MTDAEHIAALQKALAFWMPKVPCEDSEREERLAGDAYLLFGYTGEPEPSAEDRGWIKLVPKCPAIEAMREEMLNRSQRLWYEYGHGRRKDRWLAAHPRATPNEVAAACWAIAKKLGL